MRESWEKEKMKGKSGIKETVGLVQEGKYIFNLIQLGFITEDLAILPKSTIK